MDITLLIYVASCLFIMLAFISTVVIEEGVEGGGKANLEKSRLYLISQIEEHKPMILALLITSSFVVPCALVFVLMWCLYQMLIWVFTFLGFVCFLIKRKIKQ